MVLTSSGPIKDVNFPDKANNPKPDAWLFWSIDLVMKTLLADWIGPIKKPFIAAKIKKSSCVLIKRIIVDENIKPNKEKIMTDLDVNFSEAISSSPLFCLWYSLLNSLQITVMKI